ncbi:MAG TPA: TIM barrel protein [Bordetella sp.]
MPKFAANITMMFTEMPLLDRIDAAARMGFEAIECSQPYEADAGEFAARARSAGIAVALLNFPAGDWSAGERGLACHPGRLADFRASVEAGISFAKQCGASRMNCLAGVVPAGIDDAAARETLVSNLRHAAAELGNAGMDLLVEPINRYDLPGYAVAGSSGAIEVLDAVGAPNAFLQYDVYHMQRMEGELAATLQRLIGRIGHVQIADTPGRHEPGTGEINYRFLLPWLDHIGYQGWVGCEYVPKAGTEKGLAWREEHGVRGARQGSTESRDTVRGCDV